MIKLYDSTLIAYLNILFVIDGIIRGEMVLDILVKVTLPLYFRKDSYGLRDFPRGLSLYENLHIMSIFTSEL